MSDTIAVTGAAGFIGSHVSAALLDAGWTVVGIDNFDPFYDRRLKEDGLAPLGDHERFRFEELDVRDGPALQRVFQRAGVTVVVHLAARAGVRPSLADPALYASLNVEGTAAVLEACRCAEVRRVVFGSSSSVYGEATPVPFREDVPAVNPISPYAATKRAGELYCEVYARVYGLRIAALRFFTVYGPRQRPDLAIHKFTRLMAAGRPIHQYGDGSAERDHTHVEDILRGVSGAIAWTDRPEAACAYFNLGESRTVRLDRLIALIAEALGVRPRIERHPMQPGDVPRTCADITRARTHLGYDPQVPIEEGIPRFVTWYEATYGRESRSAS